MKSQPLSAGIYLTIPGEPGEHASLDDFIAAGTALRKTLKHVERCVSAGESRLDLRVSELKVSSALLSVMPNTESGDCELWDEVQFVHRDTFARLEKGDKTLDSRLDYMALSAFEGFITPLKRGKASLSVDGVTLSERFIATLHEVMEPIPPTKGSVVGMVEELNVHGKHTFVLFPAIPDSEVQCVFQECDYPLVHSAIRKHVTVFGTLTYGRGRAFPVKAKMDSLEVHPTDSEIPTLASMEGMLIGEKHGESVSLVRAMRDEW